MKLLLKDLKAFAKDAGLSDFRVGIILANNGRLIGRLEEGGEVLPSTRSRVYRRMKEEQANRNLSSDKTTL